MSEFHNYSYGPLAGKDALGRSLPMHEKAGGLRNDRYAGIFYFLCNGGHNKDGPYDVGKILQADPEAPYKPESPLWGPVGSSHHWGEPLFGYYFSDDEWVVRKHVEMLTLADVDFLVFDTTNLQIYRDAADVVLKVLEEYRTTDWKVPQVVYYTNTDSGKRAQEIYDFLYKPGRYPELWFKWEGKPLIIAYPEQCTGEVRSFFTFRLPQWPTEPQKQDGFPWMDFNRPQQVYSNRDGVKEVISVSIAQHPQILFGDSAFYGEPANRGRSFHEGENDFTRKAADWGYNFSEQWEFALEEDPQIIFVTGWNEWTAGRLSGTKDRPMCFVDTATREFSRDIGPMRGGHFDNYYMQLISYIRRFKGTQPQPSPGPEALIRMDSGFSQWEKIMPEYRGFACNTHGREHPGFGGVVYREEPARNAIDRMKVARDHENIYFYVRTKDPMTRYSFTPWMWLLISVAGSDDDHWEGYHYLLNYIVLDYHTTFLQKCKGGWRWEVAARIEYRMEGREMHLAVPRKLLGIGEGDQPFEIWFKWADNVHDDREIEDFYLYGDAAPYGRLNYVYRVK